MGGVKGGTAIPKIGIDPKTGEPIIPKTGITDPITGKPIGGGTIPSNPGNKPITGVTDNGATIVINPTQNNTSTVTNNYYKKVDDKVDQDKLLLLRKLLNSVNLIGGYTKDNLDTIRKILLELEESNSLLDSNNELSETTNELLKQLKFHGTPRGWTGDVNESGSLDFLLDVSPMEPIVQGVR